MNESFFKSHTMRQLFESDYWIGFLMGGIAWASSFLVPIVPFIIFTIVLVFADLYTGTKAAQTRNEKIHSRGLKRTVEKISLYFIALILGRGLEVVFQIPFQVAYLIAFAIAVTEFKSNIENIETVTGVNIWLYVKEKLLPKK